MQIVTTSFADRRLLIAQIVRMQDFWPAPVYADALKRLADRGAAITTAMDRHRLIGCMTVVAAARYAFPLAHRADIEAATGAPLEAFAIRSTIHVRPDHKGQGVGRVLERVTNAACLRRGFSHVLAFNCATDEVFSWLRSRPGARLLDLIDPTGRPVIAERLDRSGIRP